METIYAVTNPAWSGWVKIGKTKNTIESRLQNYNTCAPLRDFELHVLLKTKHGNYIETLILHMLSEKYYFLPRKPSHPGKVSSTPVEWIKVDLETVKELVSSNFGKFAEV